MDGLNWNKFTSFNSWKSHKSPSNYCKTMALFMASHFFQFSLTRLGSSPARLWDFLNNWNRGPANRDAAQHCVVYTINVPVEVGCIISRYRALYLWNWLMLIYCSLDLACEMKLDQFGCTTSRVIFPGIIRAPIAFMRNLPRAARLKKPSLTRRQSVQNLQGV